MRTVNEIFTDQEHKMLKKKKGKRTWHDFIFESCMNYGGKK